MTSIFGELGVQGAGWDLAYAVNAALAVLGILELPEEEQPDPAMWGHEERQGEWFKAMRARRLNPSQPGMEPIGDDDPDFMSNSLADQFR